MRTALENALYYAEKKSEQNMAAALEACTEDFILYSPPFGANLRGTKENLREMAKFFQFFPDYNVTTEHTAVGENCVILTGRVRMTPSFSMVGLPNLGKKAEVDFSATFALRGSLLQKETFLLDIVDLCNQSGLPLDVAMNIFGRKHNFSRVLGIFTNAFVSHRLRRLDQAIN